MHYPFYTVYALATFTDKPPFRALKAFTEDNPMGARKQAIEYAGNLTHVILQEYGKAANLVSWAVIADINLGLDRVYYIYQQGGLNDTTAMQALAKEYPATDPDILSGWATEYLYYESIGQGRNYGTITSDGKEIMVLTEVMSQINEHRG